MTMLLTRTGERTPPLMPMVSMLYGIDPLVMSFIQLTPSFTILIDLTESHFHSLLIDLCYWPCFRSYTKHKISQHAQYYLFVTSSTHVCRLFYYCYYYYYYYLNLIKLAMSDILVSGQQWYTPIDLLRLWSGWYTILPYRLKRQLVWVDTYI